MSAFMVEDKTINRILGYLNNNRRELCGYFTDVLKAAEVADADNWHELLGASMLMMNQDAVNYRYSETDTPPMFEFHWEMCSDVQTVKSLQCFLYQCAEGDVPERELYKALKEVKHFLMARIIGRMPEYDKADWA